ncbi:MAG: MCP four helix bundle domain-containing protein [Hyphomonadaceae bacterium]|nr:MCP four helix bundle domain-containing protein [Clostridia bacterium]
MKWFYDLNMKMKVLVGFGAISVIAVIMGIIGIANIGVINGNSAAAYKENTVAIDQLSQMTQFYQTTRVITRDIILTPNIADKNKEVENLNKIEAGLQDLIVQYQKDLKKDEVEGFNKFKNDMNSFLATRTKVIELALAKNESEAYKLIQSEAVKKAAGAVQDALTEMEKAEVTQAREKNNKNSGIAGGAVTFMVIFILLGLIAAFVIGIFISNLISAPISEMVDAAERLAQGDINFAMYNDNDDEVGMLSKSFRSVVNTIQELIKETNALSEAVMGGKLDHRAQTTQFKGEYKNLVEGINHSIASLVNFFEIIPTPITFMDKDLRIRYINAAAAKTVGNSKNELTGVKCADAWNTEKCRTDNCPCTTAMIEKKSIQVENSRTVDGKRYDMLFVSAPIMDRAGKIIGTFEVATDQTEVKEALRTAESAAIKAENAALIAEVSARTAQKVSEYQAKEVIKLTDVLGELSNGNLNVTLEVEACDEDTQEVKAIFDKVAQSVNGMSNDLENIVKEISTILEEVANGNLSIENPNAFKGDFASISDSLTVILDSLNNVMGEMNSSADQVAAGSMQVSDGSQALSQGATEQASSVEELTATITEVASKTRQNAINANQANELTSKVKLNAAQGSIHMKDMLKSMEEINQSSQNISKIIKVIDDIAFQTNMLALNAAVEAARAGQYGRGFAVVAEEVRNLAARSAKAAKETTELIAGSISKVDEGTRKANQTSDALDTIVHVVEHATGIVEEIAKASDEQASAIAQINSGVQQVSRVVQTNSATAEESAAASEELSSQAEMLKGMVGGFALRKGSIKKVEVAVEKATQKNKKKSNGYAEENQEIKITLDSNEFGKY